MFLEKVGNLASVLWVERISQAMPPASDLETLHALVDSLSRDAQRVE